MRMGLVSLLWGIVALVWMIVALIPLVGITNWLLIPFAAVGAIIAALGIALSRPGHRGRAKAGLVLNAIVIVVAAFRLSLGGGIL
jgi:MFS superfamily sulfate permease-like transporter